MDKHNNSKVIIGIIVTIISLLMIVLILGSFKSGYNQKGNMLGEYKTLQSLKDATAFELNFPSLLYDEEDLKITSVMGQIVEVSNEKIVFKASVWVDNNADPLGIYEKFNIDEKYDIIDSDLGFTYFRYRSSDITILNWVQNDTAYGLKINSLLSVEEAIDIIGITNENLIIHENNENTTEDNSNNEYYTEEIHDANVKFTLFLNNIDKVVIPTEANYYSIYGKNILVVVYNNPNKYIESLDNCEYKLFNGVYFFYDKNNPFNVNDTGYNEYNLFLETLNKTLNSIDVIY